MHYITPLSSALLLPTPSQMPVRIIPVVQGQSCPHCPSFVLDDFGHHSLSYVLVPNWDLGKPAAFDLSVTSTLHPSVLLEASMTAGSAALVAENRKHKYNDRKSGVTAGSAAKVVECRKQDMNDPKCSELGWKCTPLAVETYGCWDAEARETLAVETYGCWDAEARETLAVETYGCWGAEARETLSRLATRLAIPMRCTKSQATAAIYGRLSLTLVRSCARALLSRAGPSLVITAGAEKVIHGVRSCIKEHWIDDNFTFCKVDMSNAFNCVSRQALLEECAVHFPELLPWVGWCYGSQPTLWHPLGQLSSEVGVQQGDPLGPLLFSLVLHKVVSYIAQDRECLPLLFNGWYLDDGVLLGHSQAVNRALTLIQKMGPSLGLFVNVSKCELFGCGDLSSFPPEMKVSRVPNLVILGAPIGDLIFCAKFVAQKRADAAVLLSQLAEVGAEDPQVAFLLLRQCAAFCKLVHLARSAPPSHIAEGLALFDKDVRQCFAECTAVDAADVEWMQAQLSLSRGGLGLRSLSSHCVAAYLASISSSGCDKWNLLVEPIELFNGLVPAEDAITLETLATSNMRQHSLSGKIEDQQFRQLFHISSPANRARLLSISSRHAASWLTVVPSPGLNLHLEPNEFQIAVKWWLGMDVSFGSCCPHCPDHRLDPLGHHALTCKHGGDVVLRHNSLRDVFVEFCHRACLGGQVEVGSGQGHDRLNSRPADVLVKNWHLGKPAAFDLTITSPLNPTTLTEAGVKCGSSAQVAEVRKHAANDGKCKELGWVCIPLAVESYGCWGMEAQESFKRLAARLAIQMGCSRSQATTTLYQRLSLSLVRANARALLSRARVHLEEGG
eukprot:Em0019g1216a